MSPLPAELRRQLENICTEPRALAEARSALQKAVDAAEPFAHFTAQDRDVRTRTPRLSSPPGPLPPSSDSTVASS